MTATKRGRATAVWASGLLAFALGLGGDLISSASGQTRGGSAAAEPAGGRIDVEAAQGLLAVQNLDGWLLYDFRGQNPIAREVVQLPGPVTRRWFYLIPDEGQPIALVHKTDAGRFDRVPGRKLTYGTWRELDQGLTQLLRGRRRIAMEYSERGVLPDLSRVDAGTMEKVRRRRVKVVSSAELVQYSKSLWGKAGRESHYIAAHHLTAVRNDAFAYIARKVKAGSKVTEWDVQQRIVRGFATRGLTGDPPIVAVNANAADPHYMPRRGKAATIRKGDLVLLDLWAKLAGQADAVYADVTWMAYVGKEIPSRYERAFAAVVKARDETLDFIRARIARRRPVRGFEADQRARRAIGQAGYADKFIHRTGHSLDTDLHGAGANLDDYESHDTRTLVRGTGFTIEPGIYVAGDFGTRTEINVYVGPKQVEVTTPLQETITPIQ